MSAGRDLDPENYCQEHDLFNCWYAHYALCDTCNGATHRDDLRGTHCKWCDRELGGEG